MNALPSKSAARAVAACLAAAAASAAAADFDYRVEYVKSTHGSCVKTDLVPQPGTTFRMDVRFDGPFNQIFGGRFDHARNTTVFFGQEDAQDAEGFRDLFQLALGGHEAQTYQTFASLGRKSREKWIHCGLQEVNDSVIDCRVPIVYDGRHVTWGSFDMKLEGERTAAGKVPVSFFGMTCDDGSVKSYACYDLALYGAEFYRDGKPLARFVPVVKDGVAGLYEEVTGKFYASATDVPLEAGPKLEADAATEAPTSRSRSSRTTSPSPRSSPSAGASAGTRRRTSR